MKNRRGTLIKYQSLVNNNNVKSKKNQSTLHSDSIIQFASHTDQCEKETITNNKNKKIINKLTQKPPPKRGTKPRIGKEREKELQKKEVTEGMLGRVELFQEEGKTRALRGEVVLRLLQKRMKVRYLVEAP